MVSFFARYPPPPEVPVLNQPQVESHSDRIAFGLVGAGGFAREVMPILRDHASTVLTPKYGVQSTICFVDANPAKTELNGYPLISESDFFSLRCSQRLFNIAIGDSQLRQKIAEEYIARGAKPVSLRSTNSVVYDENEVGEGAILCANTVVTSNAKIGRFFHANIFSYVAHDCIVGDFVTFAPNVHCNGNVHVRDHAFVGTGAIIKQGALSKPLVIGEGAIVGMGAVVTNDVEPFTTVVGNPAKPLQKATPRA